MSMTTEFQHGTMTIMPGGKQPENRVNELLHNYLKLVQENPRVTRNAFQRIYDMILSYGTEEFTEHNGS